MLFDAINQYRIAQGLSALIPEETLELTAMDYCRTLIEQGRLAHRDSRGFRVLDRYREKGGTAVRAGEILGSSDDLSVLIEAWKQSPTHNDVMLNPGWTRMGSAVMEDRGHYVAVVLFSNSMIDRYRIARADGGVDLSIKSIPGSEISVSGRVTEMRELISLFLQADELPLLLIINGEKEGKKGVSDFLYLRDIFFNSTH